ncbi:MAG: Y-family DNA polymerase [Proteobacteria bacterium]|nr:Y-family DNA polymerase [Pseudomonadota bacterium]
MEKVFLLVDCNNFFVSCERVFNPQLRGKPVVVLSNNDGCVISRSEEAKQLGIPMGAPVHQYQLLLDKHRVFIFSSNFALYGDMSRRVIEVLAEFSPDLEVYSIDESFMQLEKWKSENLLDFAFNLKEKVYRYTGIPVSIGIAATKTLAKAGNRIAKKNKQYGGVCYIQDSTANDLLAKLDIEDVWGVGRKNSAKLRSYGIYTALDLKSAEDNFIRQKLTIQGLRTAHELRGISCINLSDYSAVRKTLIYSRSFGKKISTLPELKEAVSSYAANISEKLRKYGLLAGVIVVYIRTNRFSEHDPQRNVSGLYTFPTATSYSIHLVEAANIVLEKIFKSGFAYNKAGVMCLELSKEESLQL